MKAKQLNRSIWGNGLALFLLFVLGAFMLLPLIYTTASAIKPTEEFYVFPPRLYAVNPTLNNFSDLWDIMANNRVPLSRYIFNTLVTALLGTVCSVVFGLMGAYVLSKHTFPGQKMFNRIIVIALLYTGNILTVPRYLVISKLHWLDTPLAILAPTLASTMSIFLLRQFMTTVPNAMLESAKIDGAGEMRICFQMVAPSIKPAWITVIILNFQSLWNTTGADVIFTESNKLLPTAITQIVASGISRAGAGAAGTLIMIIPPILVFVIFQRQIIETMASSGIKE
ncbi:MAG: carbohydrate ABC transporter permease [Oscillospiraceae bacterium]|nr:carbohydrate ABC transporter permease [Oscillospiraceae bacterium]